MSGRNLSFCSSLPNVYITGPTIPTPNGSIGGQPANPNSLLKIYNLEADQPVPPYSTGQLYPIQPFLDNAL